MIHFLNLFFVFVYRRSPFMVIFSSFQKSVLMLSFFRSHRSFKANFGVRLFLAFCQTLSLQNDIYEWARDHRAHHKFSETDADPHNSKRGFFFSHVVCTFKIQLKNKK